MAIYTELLGCKFISEAARKELKRAGVTIHKGVPGVDNDIEIVELQHAGSEDRGGMYVWDVPREIEIASRGLYLVYHLDESGDGRLLWMDEDMGMVRKVVYDQHIEGLGELNDHPF